MNEHSEVRLALDSVQRKKDIFTVLMSCVLATLFGVLTVSFFTAVTTFFVVGCAVCLGALATLFTAIVWKERVTSDGSGALLGLWLGASSLSMAGLIVFPTPMLMTTMFAITLLGSIFYLTADLDDDLSFVGLGLTYTVSTGVLWSILELTQYITPL